MVINRFAVNHPGIIQILIEINQQRKHQQVVENNIFSVNWKKKTVKRLKMYDLSFLLEIIF